MNLIEMQKKQKELDERIIRDKNIVLSSEELLLNTLVALDIELSEMANDHQWFKIWKEDNEPKDTLIEEYVDCLHFFLSIANQEYLELEIENINLSNCLSVNYLDIKQMLSNAYGWSSRVYEDCKDYFMIAFQLFINMGLKSFNFTLEQIEQEYYRKNAINHDRQSNGY